MLFLVKIHKFCWISANFWKFGKIFTNLLDFIILFSVFPTSSIIFAQALGIDEITSPTFTIIKEYDGELPLYHMDVYRLDGNTDGVGIEEYYTKGGIVIIEWAKTIKDILPEERLEIKFKVIDENRRSLTIVPYGQKYEELCEAVLWEFY